MTLVRSIGQVRPWLLLLAFAASLWPGSASADIGVNPTVIIIEDDPPGETVSIVTNRGRERAFVTAKARIVTSPGAKDEKLVHETNPALSGLLVTPLRTVLDPSERRAIRIRALNAAGISDRIWRVQIAPAVGDLKPGTSGLAFVIAYDVLVIQRAANPLPIVAASRAGSVVTLANSGNSFAMISRLAHCLEGKCTELGAKRLYAGQTLQVTTPSTGGTIEMSIEGPRGRIEKRRI